MITSEKNRPAIKAIHNLMIRLKGICKRFKCMHIWKQYQDEEEVYYYLHTPIKIFEKGFVLNDWRTVYVGVRKHWITPEEVLSYCEYGYIECTEEMFTGLYLLPTFSEEEFVKLLRKIYPNSIWDDIDKEIIEREIDINKSYYQFWEVKKLSEIIASNKDKKDKLYEVDMIHSEFDFPAKWHSFIYYMPAEEGEKTGINALYNRLIKYANNISQQLIETKIITLSQQH